MKRIAIVVLWVIILVAAFPVAVALTIALNDPGIPEYDNDGNKFPDVILDFESERKPMTPRIEAIGPLVTFSRSRATAGPVEL